MKHFCAIVRHKDIMKTSSILFTVVLGLAPPAVVFAQGEVEVVTPVQVSFFEPEKFTDIGRSYNATQRDREGDLNVLRDHLVRQASNYLPPGYRLEVTFTNVDMAGEFEPWRGARWSDVRIVKDIYAPRLALTFRVTDADGNVVREGKRDLRDSAFMSRLSINRDDAYRHEKELLNDWLRSEFPRERKR
jgi:hypothetical protein